MTRRVIILVLEWKERLCPDRVLIEKLLSVQRHLQQLVLAEVETGWNGVWSCVGREGVNSLKVSHPFWLIQINEFILRMEDFVDKCHVHVPEPGHKLGCIGISIDIDKLFIHTQKLRVSPRAINKTDLRDEARMCVRFLRSAFRLGIL